MSYEEKNNLVTLVVSVLVMGNYFWRVYHIWIAGGLDGPEATSFIGESVLWLMAISIVAHIVAHVVFAIAHAVVTGEKNPNYVVDERDRLIELRGLRIGYFVFGAGFVGAMIALAMAWAPVYVFLIIVASFAVSGVVENLSRIAMYRLGL